MTLLQYIYIYIVRHISPLKLFIPFLLGSTNEIVKHCLSLISWTTTLNALLRLNERPHQSSTGTKLSLLDGSEEASQR